MNTPHSKTTKWLLWTARIWSIPVIAFAAMLVSDYFVNWITIGVADPYTTGDYPFIENIPPIFMLLAIIGLAIAWRFEKFGSIMNLIFCSATLPILFIHWPITEDARFIMPYILVLIVAAPGILFLLHSKRTHQKRINIPLYS